MAPSRPRQPRQSQQTQHRTSGDVATPQVAMLVDRGVMDKFSPALREFLEQMLGSSIFIDFCKLNKAKIDGDMRELILRPEWTAEEYHQLAKDMRLVWRFWADLLAFAEEFKMEEQ